MTHVKENHNGNNFAVGHGERSVPFFYGCVDAQAVFFESRINFFAKLINDIENFN